MVTKSELFWRVFQASGHVGAYLLYTSYRDERDDGDPAGWRRERRIGNVTTQGSQEPEGGTGIDARLRKG